MKGFVFLISHHRVRFKYINSFICREVNYKRVYKFAFMIERSDFKIKNRGKFIAGFSFFLGFIAAMAALLTFIDGNFLSGVWPVSLIGFFVMTSSFVTAFIVNKRARKMDKLLSGEHLIARWEISKEQQRIYSEYLKSTALLKNKAIMWIVSILFVVITIPFLFFLEGDEIGGFLMLMGGVFLIVLVSSRVMPFYYYQRNLRADRQILVGSKYIYVNGYFHNWDFPLSGLKKLSVIKEPFEGFSLTYYYTDRTWRNEHTLYIPVAEKVNTAEIVSRIKSEN